MTDLSYVLCRDHGTLEPAAIWFLPARILLAPGFGVGHFLGWPCTSFVRRFPAQDDDLLTCDSIPDVHVALGWINLGTNRCRARVCCRLRGLQGFGKPERSTGRDQCDHRADFVLVVPSCANRKRPDKRR